MAEQIRAVHADDNTIGAPRITAELNDGAAAGERVNERVARVMRFAGYQKKRRVRGHPEACVDEFDEHGRRAASNGHHNERKRPGMRPGPRLVQG